MNKRPKMNVNSKPANIPFLDSSDEDLVIIKHSFNEKESSTTMPIKNPTMSKQRKLSKSRTKKQVKDKLKSFCGQNKDIKSIFKSSNTKVVGYSQSTEIVISDDSADFDIECRFRKPITQVGNSGKIMKYDNCESYVESWVKAQQSAIQDVFHSNSQENEDKSLTIPSGPISNTTENSERKISINYPNISDLRSSSPDLFDCENSPEHENSDQNSEYLECPVDVHDLMECLDDEPERELEEKEPEIFQCDYFDPSLESGNIMYEEKLQNGNGFDMSSMHLQNIVSDNSWVDNCWSLDDDDASEKGSENGEIELKIEKQKKVISAPKQKIASSPAKVVVLDGVKRQSTITSFFGGNTSKPVLTFTDTEPKKLKNENVLKKSKEKQGDVSEATKNYKSKNCPFYKKIPGSKFSVDAFSYGSIPGIEFYFLSHFHYDHYGGLNKHFKHLIYCSQITASLVALKLGVAKSRLQILPLNQITIVDGVEVTPVDANHCPGAVMFVFYFPSTGRRILHTGDFRFHETMKSPTLYRPLQNKIHLLYLDTTYLNPSYNFPPQEDTIAYVKMVVTKEAKADNRILIVCGSYTIGKEKVFLAAADILDCSIWAEREKQRVLGCLEPEVKVRLVQSPSLARVHVLPMQRLTQGHLQSHLKTLRGRFDRIVAFKPTGWTHAQGTSVAQITPTGQGNVKIYGVPYSEHSSFGELERFVRFLSPEKVIPTVNVGKEASRNQMNTFIQAWLKSN